MSQFRSLAVFALLTLSATKAFSYDVVERYKLIDDKLKTEQMLEPIEHDFFFGVGASLNKDLKTFIDDVDKATKTGTFQAANDALVKYDETEQTVKVHLALASPLPSFSAWSVKFKPNLRVLADVGANVGIRSQNLTVADVLSYFSVVLPADFKTFVLGLSAGDDVIDKCVNGPGNGSLSASTKSFCSQFPTGKYLVPNVTQKVPTATIFGKADAKAGFFNDYTYGDHIFGNFNLYGLGRADIFQIITSEQIAKGQKIEAPKKLNSEVTLQADYRIGYANTNYRIFASVEEIKLSKLKDAPVGSIPQTYGYDPLMRIHADATYRYSILSIRPFLGVHKRKGYGFSDGMYVGTDAGAHVWGDRMGLQLRGMLDKDYFTISPRLKFWLMQLEYSLKKPVKSTDGDVKLSAINSIDLRFFF